MVRTHHQQPTLWTGFLREEVDDLWEPWMRGADVLLDDEELIDQVFEAQGRRWKRSRTRGRLQTPSEVVLRLLVLKHIRNWSYQSLEREVRANLVYRSFARIGGEKVPDAKTMGRLGQTIGPEVVAGLHRRIVELAVEKKVVQGRKMRVDTTVVETNIHYPTDSSLLGDGARVLTRLMKKVASTVGELKEKVRDRMRSVCKKVVSVAIAARRKGEAGEQQRRGLYKGLLSLSRKIVNQARRVAKEVATLPKQTQAKVRGLVEQMEGIGERTKQVIRQTKARIFDGDTKYPDKVTSLFEPHTEIIRKGKASKPTEFGKMVKIQEAENQIVTHYEVFEERPADSDLLVDAVAKHEAVCGRTPDLVAADAGFYSQANEKALEERGVPRVSIPNKNTKSEARRKHQKQRWFKNGQRWRTGCEGRISVLKRRHGLDRCLYPGQNGMKRWVGMGVIADNLINIGLQLAV
ncbi:MAG: ISNCY family transposase [Terriglobales bacterium]